MTSDLRFSSRWDATLSLNGERERRRASDARFAEVLIPRLRASYQFSRELSLRWIGELRAESKYDAAGMLASRQRSLSLDLLASYFVRPGTLVYLGYGTLLSGPSGAAMTVSRDNAFFKLSYLWQE